MGLRHLEHEGRISFTLSFLLAANRHSEGYDCIESHGESGRRHPIEAVGLQERRPGAAFRAFRASFRACTSACDPGGEGCPLLWADIVGAVLKEGMQVARRLTVQVAPDDENRWLLGLGR
jgi:hypothetical protein